MRLDEPIDQNGFFWLPGKEESRVPGRLTVAISGRTTLEFFDLASADDRRRDQRHLVPAFWPTDDESGPFPRIHGVIDGRAVTLTDCFFRRFSGSLGGVSSSSFEAERAYVGCWYDVDEAPTFTAVTYSFEGLHQWLQLSGLTSTIDVDAIRTEIKFERPTDIAIVLADGVKLSFGLSAKFPGISPDTTEVTVTQLARMTLMTDEPRSLDFFLGLALKFQNFLSLAVDQPINARSIQAISPELVRNRRPIPIDVYLNSLEHANCAETIAWHRILLSYPEIAEHFGDMLKSWFEQYDIAKPVFDLYFAVQSDAFRNIEGRFLAVMQAVEGLHRRLFPDRRKMPVSEFKALVATVVASAPHEQREIVRSSLQHANEPSLRERIEQMVVPFADHFGNPNDRSSFVRDAIQARNSLTHQIGPSSNRVLKVERLGSLALKLEALFQMHLLSLVGLQESQIDRIVEKHLEHKLNPQFE